MRALRISLLAILLLLAPLAFNVHPQDQQYGTIYFYRVHERDALAMGGKSAYVYLDDKKILSMTEERFVGVRLQPGHYVIKLKTKATETPITVEAGKMYFFRVSKTAQSTYIHDLIKTDDEQAIYQIRDLKPLEDKNISEKSLQITRDKPDNPKS